MALEALQGFEAVVWGFFSRRVFNNNFQLFFWLGFFLVSNLHSLGRAVLLPFICIFRRIAVDSALTEDYSFPGYHTRRRFLCVAGKMDREGGNSRVWDRGRIIALRCRWLRPWTIS